MTPGMHLIAYVFVCSACHFCTQPEVREQLSRVRDAMRSAHSNQYAGVWTVVVDVDRDLRKGLEYLNSVGLDNFDELDVGRGWANESLVRHVWRERYGRAATPQIIIIERPLSATLKPFDAHFDRDTLVGLVNGTKELSEWLAERAPLRVASGHPKPDPADKD
jgi:hypothetical protein